MLQTIRDKSQGWFAWVVISVLCLSFALWGISYYLGKGSITDYIVKVNGHRITDRDLGIAYDQLRQKSLLALGANAVANPAFEKQLKTQALQQLVSSLVIMQAAHKEGFVISTEQVQALILSMPAFQVDGQYSPLRFQQILASMNYTETSFLNRMRQQMVLDQMQSGFVTSAFVLPHDIDNGIKLFNQKRNVNYIQIATSALADSVKVSQDKIKQYYDAHKESFKTPEKVQLAYVELSLQKLQQAGLTKEKAQQAFAAKTEELSNLAYEDPDSLDAVAKKLQLPIKTTGFINRQGDVGKSDKNAKQKQQSITNNQNIIKAAFSDDVLKNGYNSDVIPLDAQHVVVVRIAKHDAGSIKPLASVSAKIKAVLLQQAEREQAQILGEKIVQGYKSGKSLQSLAQQNKLSLKSNISVSRQNKDIPAFIIDGSFSLPAKLIGTKDNVKGFQLPNGDYLVMSLNKVIPGKPTEADARNRTIFKKQIEDSYGQLDYDLYIKGLMSAAKIKYKSS